MISWHENLTYDLVKASQDKLRKKLDNPLEIADSGISAYHNAPIEYTFGEIPAFSQKLNRDKKDSWVRFTSLLTGLFLLILKSICHSSKRKVLLMTN